MNDNAKATKEITSEVSLEDETIRALLPGYIQRRRIEVSKLQNLLSTNSFDDIRIVGHNLKGSGGLYGLPKVGEFGAELEKAALGKNTLKITELIKSLEKYLFSLD